MKHLISNLPTWTATCWICPFLTSSRSLNWLETKELLDKITKSDLKESYSVIEWDRPFYGKMAKTMSHMKPCMKISIKRSSFSDYFSIKLLVARFVNTKITFRNIWKLLKFYIRIWLLLQKTQKTAKSNVFHKFSESIQLKDMTHYLQAKIQNIHKTHFMLSLTLLTGTSIYTTSNGKIFGSETFEFKF